MKKFLFRFSFFLLFIIILFLFFLSYFGIETNRFDTIIKEKSNQVNKNVNLDFNSTKIHFNPFKLNLTVKLKDPKVIIKNDEINLSKLNLFLSTKSFFNSDFLLKRAEVAFSKNHIKDLTKITNIFVPKIINKKIKKIFDEGQIEGEFIIPFDIEGKISDDYGFSGKIINASINLTKDFYIKNFTSEITHNKNLFTILVNNGRLLDLDLVNSVFKLKRTNNEFDIESLIKSNGDFNLDKIKKISSILNLKVENIKDVNIIGKLNTDIKFKLNRNYKVKNLSYQVEGDISNGNISFDQNKKIRKYFPKYNNILELKNSKIKFFKKNKDSLLELEGLIKLDDNFDNFNIKQTFNNKNKKYNVSGLVNLNNSRIVIPELNYSKDTKKISEVVFDFNFKLNKYLNIKKILFSSNNTKINISNLKMNKNFEINDFENIEVKTFKNENMNNDFIIKKSNNITIKGELFDAEPLLKSLFKSSDKKTFSEGFNSEIKVNFNRTITGTNDDVNNFSMIATIVKGSYEKLVLKGNFSKNEIIEMSIYQIDSGKKTLQVFSDRARPFMKNFNFIKGFEGGKLQYEAFINKNGSNANLLITDFKVSKVPALAQLLTLASLQGIADTLSGEGVRFDSFEMKTNSENNVLNIEDALAMGPAVSILIDGYVDKGKVVSLRGTLVPATKLNSIIASIPIVGDILVGTKTGDGIVGVSFKMKGPPKDIKTTVNPIKTLTPRFIVRAVEKMKKKNEKEKSK